MSDRLATRRRAGALESEYALALALALALACHACGESSTRPMQADAARAGPTSPTDADSSPRDAGEPGPVARLRGITGDVRWQPASAPSWSRARDGQELGPGDAVQTMSDGTAELVFLETGSVARLERDTTLRIPEQTPRVTRFKHLRGLLVARLDPETPGRLEVELPPGTLVLDERDAGPGDEPGAPEAHVEITKAATAVTMLEGQGRLERRKGAAITIAALHFVEVDEGGEVLAQGASPAVVELASPPDGATIRSRGRVGLEWILPAGTEFSVVEVTADDGALVAARVPAPANRAEVDLVAGHYQWAVRAESRGRAGVVVSRRSLTVEIDRTPPPLELASPRAGVSVASGTVRVAGTAEPGAVVEVNGEPAAVAADGTFTRELAIPRGLTNVVVRAMDAAGNARTVARTVLRE